MLSGSDASARRVVLVVGGRSAVAQSMMPFLTAFSTVVTAGREGCDIRIDLSEPLSAWQLPERVDVIVNAAADLGRGGFAALEQAVTVNSLGALRLCQFAQLAGARHLVHISSIHARAAASSPLFSAYSLSKRHGEELVEAACRHSGTCLTVLRPTRLYGAPSLFRRVQPAFYSILEKVAAGEDVVISGGRDPQRNFLHVDDLARVIGRCIERTIEGSFDCVSPRNETLGSIAASAIKVFGSRSGVRIHSVGQPILDDSYDRDDRPYSATGFFPSVSIEAGIAAIAAAWEFKS
jgi:nucleoside-diphosphate-sugar epimerase